MKMLLLLFVFFIPLSAKAHNLPCTYSRGDLCIHLDRSDNLKKPRSRSMGMRMTPGGEVRIYFWKNRSAKTMDISGEYTVTTNLFMKGVCGMDQFYSLNWKEDLHGKYLAGSTYVMIGDYSVRVVVSAKNSNQLQSEVLYKFTIPFE